MEPIAVVIAGVFVFTVCWVLYRAVTMRMQPEVSTSQEVPDLVMPPSASVIPPEQRDETKAAPLSARESRNEVLRVRCKDGLCRHCDEQARFPMPQLVRQSSVFDWLYRRLNVVSLNRYKLVIKPGTDAEPELCALCLDLVCGRKEKEIIEIASETAGFFDKQRLRVYVFERHECDELVQADVLEARRPRKKKQAAATPNVLAMVKTVNGNS